MMLYLVMYVYRIYTGVPCTGPIMNRENDARLVVEKARDNPNLTLGIDNG